MSADVKPFPALSREEKTRLKQERAEEQKTRSLARFNAMMTKQLQRGVAHNDRMARRFYL